LAKAADKKEKLEVRYQAALSDARKQTCEAEAIRFQACCKNSAAVFACGIERLHREVAAGTEIFETYRDLERLRLIASPQGKYNWTKLRPQAEIELLGSAEHLDKIHYACLSLDGSGLTRYGDCFVQLAERMIAHRASCFGGNTSLVFANSHDFSSILRSDWADRHRMCVASFCHLLAPGIEESQFPGILVAMGTQVEDDRFIEVHVFGAMTARSFESVRVQEKTRTRKEHVLLKAVTEKLAKVKVTVSKIGHV
jgi:hypothetical protein